MVWWLLYSMFLNPIYECLAAEIEIAGCTRLVPITFVKGPQDELFLDRFQADALRREVYLECVDASSFLFQELRQIFDSDVTFPSQNDDALYDILQFAHVARPTISHEVRQQSRWHG